ncbi:MAG: hypothetical protein K7J15_04595, partial [Candidatus Regiella insecticola]|nr:hypothetical protein [Candidatus Regiella insecticola]MCX2959674.1 hypothetical protein [Serratia symbiotica]
YAVNEETNERTGKLLTKPTNDSGGRERERERDIETRSLLLLLLLLLLFLSSFIIIINHIEPRQYHT